MSTRNGRSYIHHPVMTTSGCPSHQHNPRGSIPINAGQLTTNKPENPVHGDLFLDMVSNKMMVYDGTAWLVIAPGENESVVDQFDIVTDDEGFFKVKLYEHTNGKRSVMIWDGDDLFLGSTEESIDFLKNNLKDKYYLWVEKRILNHLS